VIPSGPMAWGREVGAEHWQNRGAVAGGGSSSRSRGQWRRLSRFRRGEWPLGGRRGRGTCGDGDMR
jgi:hypothetical protein